MSSKLTALVDELKESNDNATDIYSKLGSRLKKKKSLTAQLPADITEPIRRDVTGKNVECADAALKFLLQIHSVVLNHESDAQALDCLVSDVLRTTASEQCVNICISGIFESMLSSSFIDVCYRNICKEKKDPSLAIKNRILPLASKFALDQENLSPDHESRRAKMVGIILVFTVDKDDVLRKAAVTTLRDFIADCTIQPSHIATVMSCLKNLVVPKLDRFTGNVESLLYIIGDHVPLYLRVIGVSMRKSGSLTNAILKIMELGFRHTEVNVKAAAFNSWKSFIDVLSADLEILSSARYMNLVMQPLVAVQTNESLDILRIKTLWGLANRLQNKLPALFSTVCLPILHCCLGNLDCSRARSDAVAASNIKGSRSSNNGSGFYAAMQATGYRATPKKASKSFKLHDIGVEVLIHLLAYPEDDDSNKTNHFTMTKLDRAFLATPAIFGTYGAVLVATVEEVLRSKSNISADLSMLLWDRLHRHLKSHLDSNLQKNKREPELFNMLFLALKNIMESQNLERGDPHVTFSMLKSFLDFPASVMSSTFYGGHLNGKHGFPVLTLIKMLFSGRLTCVLSAGDDALELWDCTKRLVVMGFESMVGFLSFCGSVIEIITAYAQDVLAKENKDSDAYHGCVDLLFKTWVKLGVGLNSHIKQSQEVNQGDNFDHDFSALYGFLLFPMHLNGCRKDCSETWNCIYEGFLWASDVVATCKPNELCRHLCSAIRQRLDRGGVSDSVLTFLVGACQMMVEKADYNHRGIAARQRASRIDLAPSPKRQSVSESLLERHKNLSDLCLVMLRLFEVSRENNVTKHRGDLMNCLSKVISSIYYSEDIRTLFRTFVPAFKNILSSHLEDVKVFREPLETIFYAVENVYKSAAVEKDSIMIREEFHDFISSCVKNGGGKIRNAAVEFWGNVVVNSQHHGLICDNVKNDVKSCLFPVYQKMGWDCPWKDVELPATMDLADFDDNTQSLKVVGYGAFGSPAKKNLVPKSPHKSPLRPTSNKTVSTPFAVKRKLDSVSENVNYVNCVSPYPKPRTPLTERQKEKLAEREFIPTMYNELDEKQEQKIDVDTQEASVAEDVIGSSQAQESPRKRLRVDAGARNTEKSDANSSVSESRNVDTTLDKSERMDSDRYGITTDNKAEDSVASGLNADDSYEYVAMHDASSNQTRCDETISAGYEDTDLGVKPLDDSYECVMDMSACAANSTSMTQNSGARKENNDMVTSGSCVKEVSVCLEQLSTDLNNTPTPKGAKSKRSRRPKKNRAVKSDSNEIVHSGCDDNSNLQTTHETLAGGQQQVPAPKIRTRRGKKQKSLKSDAESRDSDVVCAAHTASPAVRRSKRKKKSKSEAKDADAGDVSEKSAVESVDLTETTENVSINNHDTTEYEYVAVADSSSANLTVCVAGNDTAQTSDLTQDKTTGKDLVDNVIEGVDSAEDVDANDHDTTEYECVAVADSSSANLTVCAAANDTAQTIDLTQDETTGEDSAGDVIKGFDSAEGEDTKDHDTTEYEYVAVADSSSANLTICVAAHDVEPTIDTAEDKENGVVTAADNLDTTEDAEHPSVPTCNTTFDVEPDSDEEDFLDARASIDYQSDGNVTGLTVGESGVSVDDSSVNEEYESAGDDRTVDESIGDASSMDESVVSVSNSSVNVGEESAGNASAIDESVVSVNSSVNAGSGSASNASAMDESIVSVNAGHESASNASAIDESVNVGDESIGIGGRTISKSRSPNMDLSVCSNVVEVNGDGNMESSKSEKPDYDMEICVVVSSGSTGKETVELCTEKTNVETELVDASSRKSDIDIEEKEDKVAALVPGTFASPNSKSILKRRSSVVEPDPAAASSPVIKKRVSFANSIAGPGCHVQQSPRSSLLRKRSSPKVSRRLSLQPDRMMIYCKENGGAVSPLSVRSAQVKEAIANIRAKESGSPSGRYNVNATGDFNKSMRDLREILNPAFIRSLNKTQSKQLHELLNSASSEVVENVCST